MEAVPTSLWGFDMAPEVLGRGPAGVAVGRFAGSGGVTSVPGEDSLGAGPCLAIPVLPWVNCWTSLGLHFLFYEVLVL